LKRTLIIDSAGSFYAVRRASVQPLKAPLGKSDADDRDLEGSTLYHCIECGEDHLVREIAGRAKDYKSIGLRGVHETSSFLGSRLFLMAAAFGTQFRS
jgi:hypothetical protein